MLLASLTKSLAVVLPFLEQALERNFAAAGAASAAGQREVAQQHVAAIQAALGGHGVAQWGPACSRPKAGAAVAICSDNVRGGLFVRPFSRSKHTLPPLSCLPACCPQARWRRMLSGRR